MTLTISDLSPFKRRNAGNEEIHALLDLLPHPTLIASARTGRILFSNGGATELTAFTRKELSELAVSTLLPELVLSERGKQAGALVKRNSQSVAVVTTVSALSGTDQWLALSLESSASTPAGDDNRQRWEALHLLSLASQQPELASAYRQILQAGALLTGARHLVLYTPGADGALQVQAVHGSSVDFPSRLEAQDLAALRVPKMWQPGRSIESQLQRAAHANKLSYLATTPLDLTQPEVGLLAAADEDARPSEELLTLLQILAASAATAALNAQMSNTWRRDAGRLSESEKISTVLHEHMQDGVLFTDTSLRLTELNMAAEAMLGYSQAEVAQRPVHEVLIGTRALLPELEMALQGSEVMELGKRKLLRRDGQEFIALVRLAPIAPNGKTTRLAILISDLSEHEAFHLQTLQMSDRAWLGDVAAIFAHEMQNPLNNISTSLQLMQMSLPENDPGHEQLRTMLEDCERLARYMHSMLGVARGRAHQPEPMDIAEFCRQQVARWRVRLQRKNIKDHLQIAEDIPFIMGDAHALEQVFTNLFTNAMQAMSNQESGLLALNVSRAGDDMVEIVISDNGPGVPEDLRARIFEAFFTTKGGEGTGLGLSITRRIVMAHKGEITLESFPGGTMFKLRLPIAQN
ncbi:MAG: PAS domain S-box protein [Anaerolineales bacterium]|nr:PAS domain S-box protein [Anaerolineales bacterium]